MTFEWHYGEVTNNDDPEQLGKIKFKCDTLIEDGGEYPEWASPSIPFVHSEGGSGMFDVPTVGTLVELKVCTDDISCEVIDVRYECCFYNMEDKVPSEFTDNYPNRRGWKTPSGHILLFDDDPNSGFVQLKHKDAANLYIDKDGILVEQSSSVYIYVKQDGTITIKGTEVNLGDETAAREPALKATTTRLWLDKHSHNCPLLGTSGPPNVPTDDTVQSTIVKVDG